MSIPNHFWLVKTDASGNQLWNKTYGGTGLDDGYSVIETVDGGYAVVGTTGYYHVWLVKTDTSGNQLWNKTYGGTSDDRAWSLIQTNDGGYALAGDTLSYGPGSHYNAWLVKAYEPGNEPLIEVEYGLAWTTSTQNAITLYRGANDPYWNYVRIRIWKIKDSS